METGLNTAKHKSLYRGTRPILADALLFLEACLASHTLWLLKKTRSWQRAAARACAAKHRGRRAQSPDWISLPTRACMCPTAWLCNHSAAGGTSMSKGGGGLRPYILSYIIYSGCPGHGTLPSFLHVYSQPRPMRTNCRTMANKLCHTVLHMLHKS